MTIQGNIVENLSANVQKQNQAQTTPVENGPAQSEENAEVKQFLSSIKLEKYEDKLIENGVEDLETILELRDEHIEQIGIPLGHKLKIMKKIKDLRAE